MRCIKLEQNSARLFLFHLVEQFVDLMKRIMEGKGKIFRPQSFEASLVIQVQVGDGRIIIKRITFSPPLNAAGWLALKNENKHISRMSNNDHVYGEHINFSFLGLVLNKCERCFPTSHQHTKHMKPDRGEPKHIFIKIYFVFRALLVAASP